MKKFYAILCLAIASLTQLQAQAPQGFNYQAQVRNSAGDLIVNTNVYFKFNIMQGSQTSLPVFTEIHYAPTDDLGQISLVIGQGSATTGAFSELDWSLGSYFLGIELDTGNGYVAMGTTQLLSVPYALYAENSGNAPPTTPNLQSVLAENNSANNQQIKDLQDPTDAQDAVTKAYLDNLGISTENSSRYQMDSFSWYMEADGWNYSEVVFGFNMIDTQTGIVKTYFRNWNLENYSFYRVTNTYPEINNSANGRFQVSSWGEAPSGSPYQKLFGFNVIDTQTGIIKCFRNIYPGESFYECSTTNPIDSTYDFDGDGFSESQGDCDDTDDSINPNVIEVCDGIDNDCDGLIDEGVLIIFYQDLDSDGFGNPDVSIESCSLPSGYSNNNLDCDDQNPQVNPQVIEVQDGIDNDCDGVIDEAVLATLYTNTIFNVTISSAQSGGTITDDGGGTVSSRGVVWSTGSTPTLDNNEGQTTDGSGSGSFVSSLSALNPGTTYNVRAYATNEAGTAYGQVETFTTEIDFSTLTTTAITDITVDSAQSGGTITDDGGGTVSSRGIVWSTGSTPTLDNNEGQTTDGSGSGSFVSSLSALSPGTTYNVRAYATNEAGTAYGQVETFTTEIDFATLTTTAITDISVDSAQSGGTISDVGGGTVSSRGVVWSTGSTPTLEDNEGQTTDGSGSGSFVSSLSALSPGTTYNVRAYATNEAGTAYGQVETFTTEIDFATLTTTAITDISVDSAQSGGTISDVGGGTVSSRGVVWSTGSTPTLEDNEGQTTDGSGSGSFVSSLSALSPGTTYNVRAYATNEAGTAYGQVETFTTEIDFATLTTTAITDISVDSAQSGGTISDVGGGTVSSRGVVWSTGSTPTLEDNEGQTTDGSGSGSFVSSLSALSPGTTYNVRAYATNEAGTAYGQLEVFTTITENDIDNDGDGYSVNQCDCNDNDPAINPGASEINDDVDNDCDGLIDENENNQSSGIFFSQFIETPGNDGRAIEIYNGTSNSIDLTDYQISVCINGCDTQNVFDYIDRVTFSEGSIIQSGDVFVISNIQSSELILNASDLQSNSIQFTGNDTYALTTSCSTADNYTIIDIIGDLDTSANVYNVAGQDLSNKTIIRKSNICSPNPIPLDSFGTNETDSEWIVSDGNANWNYIGSHYTNCQDSNSSDIDDDGDGYTENDGDCDDTDATIYPGATDIEDGIDNDCDGEIDEIFDMDGDGYTENDGDCDDTDATVYPGATELEDGFDNDCDGEIDECFNESGMLTDQDGNTYNYLTYCDQAWSVENAEMVTYRDGTEIPEVTDPTQWNNLTTGAWAYYDNDPTKGKLYNWYAVAGIHDVASFNDASLRKEFAPEGWHVPSDAEWTTLENYLIANGYNYDGTTTENKIAKAMASTTGWNSSTGTGAIGNDQNLNNSSGFNAFPEGYRDTYYTSSEGSRAYFWSSVQYNTYYAWSRNLITSSGSLIRYRRYKQYGFSVRFVRD